MRFESRINDILFKTAIHESMDRTYNSLLNGRSRVDIGDVIVTESRSRGLHSYKPQTINENILQNIRNAANALFGRELTNDQFERATKDRRFQKIMQQKLAARTYKGSDRQGKLDMIAKYVRKEFSQQILSKAKELMGKFGGDTQVQRDTRRAINKLYGTVADSIKSWTPQLKELTAKQAETPAETPAEPATAEPAATETAATETAATETAATEQATVTSPRVEQMKKAAEERKKQRLKNQ